MKECLTALLENEMPCWYYDKKDLKTTPSINDGISFETERRYRKEGARLIMECGKRMKLGHNTVATGIVYFHRFYMFHSFKLFPRYVTACCCLLLAGKVEETPKKCRDIIKTARSLLSDDKFLSFGEDPKEEVMTLERILLQTIKFDLQVEHPYSFLIKYASCFKCDKTKLEKIVQMAWNFVNDSLSTTVCLQWEPEIIAIALIYLATKLSKFHVVDWSGRKPHHLRWWDMYVADVTMEILEDICHQVLDLYQPSSGKLDTGNSPPQIPTKDSPQNKSVTSSPNVKTPTTTTTTTAQQPTNNVQPKPVVVEEKQLEGNPIPTLAPKEPFNYMPGYNPAIYAHATHFAPVPVPSGSVPPPPMPPYGAQYASQPPTQPLHYAPPLLPQPPYHPSTAYYQTAMSRSAYSQPPP